MEVAETVARMADRVARMLGSCIFVAVYYVQCGRVEQWRREAAGNDTLQIIMRRLETSRDDCVYDGSRLYAYHVLVANRSDFEEIVMHHGPSIRGKRLWEKKVDIFVDKRLLT